MERHPGFVEARRGNQEILKERKAVLARALVIVGLHERLWNMRPPLQAERKVQQVMEPRADTNGRGPALGLLKVGGILGDRRLVAPTARARMEQQVIGQAPDLSLNRISLDGRATLGNRLPEGHCQMLGVSGLKARNGEETDRGLRPDMAFDLVEQLIGQVPVPRRQQGKISLKQRLQLMRRRR